MLSLPKVSRAEPGASEGRVGEEKAGHQAVADRLDLNIQKRAPMRFGKRDDEDVDFERQARAPMR